MDKPDKNKKRASRGIRRKILLPATALMILIIVLMFSLSLYFLMDVQQKVTESTESSYDVNIKIAVETLVSALNVNNERYEAGYLTEYAAYENAKTIVRDTRYSSAPGMKDDGYFWADMADGLCIVHYNPANEGAMRYDAQDLEGTYFIRNFIKRGDEGGGYSDFYFGKPGDESGAYKKRGYTLKFEPYGWYISTGNYYDDIEAFLQSEEVRFRNDIIILVGLSVFLAVAGILFLSLYIKKLVKPIVLMARSASGIAEGNLDLSVTYESDDEIGQLSAAFRKIVATLSALISGMNEMAERHNEGDVDDTIDSGQFSGAYKEVALGVNGMVSSYIDLIRQLIGILNNISNGRFDIDVIKLPGKKVSLTIALEGIKKSLGDVSAEILALEKAAADGDMSKRPDVSKYKGNWADILSGLNVLLDHIDEPIREASKVLMEISAGNLDKKILGHYKGDFALIKSSVNGMSESIASYINELSNVLSRVSENDLNQVIDREYHGQFGIIKTSVNMIIDKLNGVIGELNASSKNVSVSSRQISESSMTLAEGASRQASAIEELTATIDVINEKSSYSTENAVNARSIAEKTNENAKAGNEEMHLMTDAIRSIEQSSTDISNIIKTIEEIALQTNLLALNAAVEAARAGEHGKGFMVVADEVRSLASKSQKSANETTELIENSIRNVNEGTRIAGLTAQYFDTIVGNISEVTSIIERIANDSIEQSGAIKEISAGLSEISVVVQDNSSTSEETAAAAAELNSQSESLMDMVSVFTLKKRV